MRRFRGLLTWFLHLLGGAPSGGTILSSPSKEASMPDVSGAPMSPQDLSLEELEAMLKEINEIAQEVVQEQRRILALIADRTETKPIARVLQFTRRNSNHLGAVESGG